MQAKKAKIIRSLQTLAFLVLFITFTPAHAAILYSQPDSSGSDYQMTRYKPDESGVTRFLLGGFTVPDINTDIYYQAFIGTNLGIDPVNGLMELCGNPTCSTGHYDWNYFNPLQDPGDVVNGRGSISPNVYNNQTPQLITGHFKRHTINPGTYYLSVAAGNFFYHSAPTIRLGASGAPFAVISDTPLTVSTSTLPSNVLFLPGIEGSRLYRPGALGEDRLWEPSSDADAQDLALDLEGQSTRNDIYTKDVIGTSYVGGPKIYDTFSDTMNTMKSQGTIGDWEAIPYDWRLSLDDILNYGNNVNGKIYYSGTQRATSTPYIIQELKKLAASSHSGKVTIVAHSNGGLVAKRLTQILGESVASQLIDKIVFVDVPQLGTPKAVAGLLHGTSSTCYHPELSYYIQSTTFRTIFLTSSGPCCHI
jgi:pimeloyl-ACP methyl ester carboxylesterase